MLTVLDQLSWMLKKHSIVVFRSHHSPRHTMRIGIAQLITYPHGVSVMAWLAAFYSLGSSRFARITLNIVQQLATLRFNFYVFHK